MAPSESLTSNLGAIDRIYAGRAEVETDAEGKVPHIDVANENQDGPPVDLANVGVPVGAESQAVQEDDGEEDDDPDGLIEGEEPETGEDEDELEEELEEDEQ